MATNLDAILYNLNLLKEQYEDHEEDETWWEDEFGRNLLWQIDCHPIFLDDTLCLNETRGIPYKGKGWSENCQECKAKWLMEEFE